MIDRKALLADLRRQLKRLEQDLAERAKNVPEMTSILQEEYRAARDAERTGDTFLTWRASALSQAAVAWLLGCVFVRFAEDNGLVDAALIAGPGERNARAEDRQTLYFRARPTDSDRDYLLDVFAEVARLPGIGRLYDRVHNPVWRYGISGDAARDLLAFWRAVDPDSGALRNDFTDSHWDTRFFGDLYQDLSDEAKKRFALLQTPEFVEEFILDRTLIPALDEFGLPGIRLIDPACGSGHFLLGAFARLQREWFNREPGTPERVLVQRALDGVYGVDVNPFAAAIARFRLLVAALRASRVDRLRDAPNFRINVAAGDSLLHGRRFGELDLGSGADQIARRQEFGHAFLAENLDELNRILGQQYHVVVGNPPYVTVKDKAVNRLYRERYTACYMKYALSAPFAERFIDLAIRASAAEPAGHVGQITSNSFMKREFGGKLIEEVFPAVDLTHVIDTSGAYIPGHGTPTVILFSRNRTPVTGSVRAVLGKRGEPATPDNPANGKVWRSIISLVDLPGSESEWVSVSDIARGVFHEHPWSLGGGGAQELQELLETGTGGTLGDVAVEIGITAVTGEDGLYILGDAEVAERLGVERRRRLVIGDNVRDWTVSTLEAVWLYDSDLRLLDLNTLPRTQRYFWRYRSSISSRKRFGTPMLERGLTWYEYQELYANKLHTRCSITFAFVATHNHFVFDRGDKVFNRSAPVIKLPADATESDHLELVGLLNSSTTCFWMKQTFHNKGSTVDAHGARQTTDAFENFYEYTGTGLKRFPLATERSAALAEILERLATGRQTHLPAQLADRIPMAPAELDAHSDTAAELLARMMAVQEELDWECYRLYGIVDEDCRYLDEAGNSCEPPPLTLSERAFEIVMARHMAAGELETTWFTRHSSTPITELPAHWPDDYRTLVERRIELIDTNRFIGLIEKPEYKRRWNVEPWHVQEQLVLRNWLLSRLESFIYWPETRLASVATLAQRAATDSEFQQVATRYAGHAGVDVGFSSRTSWSPRASPPCRYNATRRQASPNGPSGNRLGRYRGVRTKSTPTSKPPPSDGKTKPRSSVQPVSKTSSAVASRMRLDALHHRLSIAPQTS